MMQCFAITGLISILWVAYGYSIAFDATGMEAGVVNFNSFIGGFGKAFLAGITPASITGPSALFAPLSIWPVVLINCASALLVLVAGAAPVAIPARSVLVRPAAAPTAGVQDAGVGRIARQL